MPIDDETRRSLAALVRERGYEHRQEPFRLSSGGESHDYVDCRRVVATGAALTAVAQALVAAVDVDWDVIGGPTMGADPLAHAAAMVAGKSWFSVRKAPKGHGRGSWVEGHPLAPGDRVLAVEDTVSTGRSLLESLEHVRELGGVIVAATALLDRSPSVGARLQEAGIPWHPLLTWADIGIEPI